jgi:transposase
MTLHADPVPMPTKKVTYKRGPNGTTYVYLTLRAYRNRFGKPTSDEAAIGKKDPATGMLIPNRRYFELVPGAGQPKEKAAVASTTASPTSVCSYGTSFCLFGIARAIGLQEVLERCFPDTWSQILAVASYMLCEGNVMMYLDDWFDETCVSYATRIDSKRCSRLFAELTDAQRMRFFSQWVKHRFEREYIAYDVTSISTYSKGIDSAEWGYNRDHESLPQVNLGMFVGAESRIPVYYSLYSGSICDKNKLEFMTASAGKLGLTSTRFVMDRGFVTHDNMNYMDKKRYQFVTALPQHQLETRRLIADCSSAVRTSSNRIPRFGVFAKACTTEVFGFKLTAHVYFDTQKQAQDEKEMYAHIERLQTDLKKMSKKKLATKKYTDYFDVRQTSAGVLSFEPNNEKIDEQLRRSGYFVLLTNDETLSSEDVLALYRGRDVIEKNFEQFKDDLEFRRLHTHINRTTDGKVFVGFIALILRSYLQQRIKERQETKHLTIERVLLELRKIRYITFEDSSRIPTPTTKLQKTILTALGFSLHELQVSLQ